MGVTLEVCVDSAEGLAAAIAGGADRVELCSALSLGGLTPSAGLIALAARAGVPVMAMIRPRAGDFVWSTSEVRMMEVEINTARSAGLSGVVLGASLQDGRLDRVTLAHLIAGAGGLDLTLHRCFDLVTDMTDALETAVALGFRRVLTSGGALTAEAGVVTLSALVAQAAGRISIMPGAGVSPANAALLRGMGVTEFHGSCSEEVAVAGLVAALGFAPPVLRRTSAEKVRALKAALLDRSDHL